MVPRGSCLFALLLCVGLQIELFSTPNASAQFFTPAVFAGGDRPESLTAADVNNDGELDLVGIAVPPDGPALMVLLGNGAGGFRTPIFTPLTGLQVGNGVSVGDFNGDGKVDVAVGNRNSVTGTGQIAVFLGNGDGTFQSPIISPSCNCQGTPGPLVAGNFNGDHNLDLAVGEGNAVNILLGKGDGTFSAPTSISVPTAACLATGDFNNDGNLDLTTGTSVLLGKGNGTFQSPLPVNSTGCGVAVADFNGDGNLDIVTGAGSFPSDHLEVLLGKGNGTFEPGVLYLAGFASGPAGGLIVADFNNDNKPDIAALNPINRDITVLLNKGDGTGTFRPTQTYHGGSTTCCVPALVAGDFNGDHHIDLAAANEGGVSVFLNRGNGTFPNGLDTNFLDSLNVQAGDLNNDGKLDIVETENNNNVLLGNGNGTFRKVGLPPLTNCATSPSGFNYGEFAIGDFNGDGKLDLAVVSVGPGSNDGVCVLLGKGDGTFKTPVLYDASVPHSFVRAGDFNNDGKLDLAVSDPGGISILLGNGDGTFQAGIPSAVGSHSFFTLGDFNHDGKLDIAATDGSVLSILLGKGDGTFQSPMNSNVTAVDFVPADLNKDGNLDLVGVVPFGSRIVVLLGNGDGTFKSPVEYLDPNHRPFSIAISDFNGDGNLDVAVANSDTSAFLTLFPGRGDGTLGTPKFFQVGLGSTAVAAGDFNGDKKIDVLVMNSHTFNFTVLLNTSP